MKTELIHLIKSLSPGEKRAFKLQTKKQAGNKAYIDLFDIINQSHVNNNGNIEIEFKNRHPTTSIETTSQYLFNLVTNTLIQIRIDHDPQFYIYQCMMRSKLFFERSLPQEGYKEIKKIEAIAIKSQNYLMQYQAVRLYLDFLTEYSFMAKSEQELVGIQYQGKKLLHLLRQIQEHHTLYELLEYRLIQSGKALSEAGRKKLDDLVLSELILISQRLQTSFETQKLHLLFQSFYFMHTGDYPSALKTFSNLTQLFEDNKSLWGNPPYAYLRALEGILDSLRTMRIYDEMKNYLGTIGQLTQGNYNDHFKAMCELIINTYHLIRFIQSRQWEKAKYLVESIDQNIVKNTRAYDVKRLSHLLFYASQTFFHLENWEKAGHFLNLLDFKSQQQSALLKAMHLLNFLNHYQEKNMEFLSYEIRNYKRTQRKKGPLTQTEKMIFKVIKFEPHHKSRPGKAHFYQKISAKLKAIREDKYEQQLLKYFDFTEWVYKKLNKK